MYRELIADTSRYDFPSFSYRKSLEVTDIQIKFTSNSRYLDCSYCKWVEKLE
ncbi:hypothetical protein [Flavobacterium sp.]|uniref:hypothetical protein n=1 Tax=Flavobacterium sp. TaxID=239 RepID=UPI003D11139B